jgi:hypothetical protein
LQLLRLQKKVCTYAAKRNGAGTANKPWLLRALAHRAHAASPFSQRCPEPMQSRHYSLSHPLNRDRAPVTAAWVSRAQPSFLTVASTALSTGYNCFRSTEIRLHTRFSWAILDRYLIGHWASVLIGAANREHLYHFKSSDNCPSALIWRKALHRGCLVRCCRKPLEIWSGDHVDKRILDILHGCEYRLLRFTLSTAKSGVLKIGC